MEIRTRIAPSPTGNLHLGTARSALFNYLFARKHGGVFVLRIEDTDLERSKKEYEQNIIDGLNWLGLEWDEGPDPKNPEKYLGDFGSYRQTERNYEPFIQKLLDKKKAFFCYHSKEELELEKKKQLAAKEPQRHLCSHFAAGKPAGTNEPGIIRLKIEPEKIKFRDLIRDEIEFDTSLLGDISLAKDAKTPLYNLAVVIDDAEMKISHVIRGEDHISNTPKQILISRALGFETPQFAHLPLLLGPDRSKLSKRHGATSIWEFKEQGYFPEAMVNFMALLGWNAGDNQEIFSLQELIKEFSLEKVGKSGSVVNIEKLNSLNSHYLKQLSLEELREKAGIAKDVPPKIISLAQERALTLNDTVSQIAAITEEPDYQKDLLLWKDNPKEKIKEALLASEKIISQIDEKDFQENKIQEALLAKADEIGDRGLLLWPLRVALSGKKQSPPPFVLAEIWGREKTLSKIAKAIKKLETPLS